MNSVKRIGIFGGTFDPIHNAHCDIARVALETAQLDKVLFVVSARPPHKGEGSMATPEERYAMVQAAVAGQPGFEATRIELDRSGPSYTVDTLRTLHAEYPTAELYLIIGFDSLLDLPKWKEAETILTYAQLLVVPRPHLDSSIPPDMEGHYALLPFQETTLSSTEVRDCIIAGEPIGHLVPSSVETLIRERGIYHAHDSHGPRG